MRVFAAALAVLVATTAVLGASNVKDLFESFKVKYAKKYASAQEEAERFAIFAANMRRAAQLEASNPLAKFGVNEFADMSAEEFKSRHNSDKFYATAVRKAASQPKVEMSAAQKLAAAGQSIDWRTKGAVTEVKNQGQCGSCWSFSTTGGIEGQWFLAGHELTSLSEQYFVSCDTIDQGCNGGLMDNAYKWVLQAHSGNLVTEASYPYVSGGGQVPACNLKGTKFGAQISGIDQIQHNEDDMAAWTFANGPLSIAVDASSWQTYMGGIMTNCVSTQLDHGVLIVGFNREYSTPYWIVKNSWGPQWGEQGYIRVEFGTNQCLINNYPASAKVTKNGPTPPPGPTPAPGKKEFTQRKCSSPKCEDCKDVVLPQDECITGQKFSYKASCSSVGLKVDSYIGRKCEGSPMKSVVNPVNQCDIEFDSEKSETFIQNICHDGPAPTPAPTNPPTPAPSNQMFVQMDCTDSTCNQGCQNHSFPANTCLQLSGGGSAKAECKSDSLTMTEYPVSQDCTGFSIPSTMPLNQCLQNGDGQGYFENFCPNMKQEVAASKAKLLSSRKH